MRILTIDLGTSATKAVLWSEDGPVAIGRAPVEVEHPRAGWVEQDPEDWWTSTLAACGQLPVEEAWSRVQRSLRWSAARRGQPDRPDRSLRTEPGGSVCVLDDLHDDTAVLA